MVVATGQRRRWRSDETSAGPFVGTVPDPRAADPFEPDPYRHVVFPNRIRELRIAHGHLRLMAFAASVPDIPYIRLSKIERGEVFARTDELARIAAAIGVEPRALLIDVMAPDFDDADWFAPFADAVATDPPAEARFAVMLAAALRRRRAEQPGLSAVEVDRRFGLAPVILSRIENAHKGLERWSAEIAAALCRLFGVDDTAALRRLVEEQHDRGDLTGFAIGIADPDARRRRTARRVAGMIVELEHERDRPAPPLRMGPPPAEPGMPLRPRRVPVLGVPADAPGGLMLTRTDGVAEAPTGAGPRSFAVRTLRATLGIGLPGAATAIIDPDRYPRAGGLALVRDGDVHRIMAVLVGRDGMLVGRSSQPDVEIPIDALRPTDVAAVIAAHFI